jgi:phytanoyl-CoA hydroxylase
MRDTRLTRFRSDTAPWLDRILHEIDEYIGTLATLPDRYDLRDQLIRWMRDGFVVFPGLVEDVAISAYLNDVDELMTRPADFAVRVNAQGVGIKPINEYTSTELTIPHLRLMDFHNSSVAGKQIALHPGIVSFLGHVFRSQVVAMQTLTFLRGTEQPAHQDYAYVVADIPSHLAASWVALEDVHPDAGPLFYWPGSHTIPRFDWGNGPFLTPSSTRDETSFRDHIEAACAARGLQRREFLPRKGDVFLWHAALAHGGAPVIDPDRTRKSLVTHYSTLDAYPFDRRAPDRKPVAYEYNGALVYANPDLPEEEDVFRGSRAAAPLPTRLPVRPARRVVPIARGVGRRVRRVMRRAWSALTP